MTTRISGRDQLVRALRAAAFAIEEGSVASCSLEYEPNQLGRLSIVYLTGDGELPDEDLPSTVNDGKETK